MFIRPSCTLGCLRTTESGSPNDSFFERPNPCGECSWYIRGLNHQWLKLLVKEFKLYNKSGRLWVWHSFETLTIDNRFAFTPRAAYKYVRAILQRLRKVGHMSDTFFDDTAKERWWIPDMGKPKLPMNTVGAWIFGRFMRTEIRPKADGKPGTNNVMVVETMDGGIVGTAVVMNDALASKCTDLALKCAPGESVWVRLFTAIPKGKVPYVGTIYGAKCATYEAASAAFAEWLTGYLMALYAAREYLPAHCTVVPDGATEGLVWFHTPVAPGSRDGSTEEKGGFFGG